MNSIFTTPTDLFGTLLEAQSEDDVRYAVLAELPLGRLEFLEIDYFTDNIMSDRKPVHRSTNGS